ncbi:MAG: flagellar hook-basal body complex protein FliE [Gammaproteobacteria bacterium]|nr:flagellar hook-basal body complex protein FliE [Gammaproteobacteria bacterium]
MNTIDPGNLLLQMRALAARANALAPGGLPNATTGAPGAAAGGDFTQVFKQALDGVNETQRSAAALTERFERGDGTVNVASVMIATQKADIAFQAATQVRNRLVSAYQEIMNMPI